MKLKSSMYDIDNEPSWSSVCLSLVFTGGDWSEFVNHSGMNLQWIYLLHYYRNTFLDSLWTRAGCLLRTFTLRFFFRWCEFVIYVIARKPVFSAERTADSLVGSVGTYKVFLIFTCSHLLASLWNCTPSHLWLYFCPDKCEKLISPLWQSSSSGYLRYHLWTSTLGLPHNLQHTSVS